MLPQRILIVGHGSIGSRHLRLARSLLPRADIRILRHQQSELIPAHADGCFFDLKDAISYAPQLAIIASPASVHMSTAYALAKAGAHLFVEKPLSSSIAGVPSLIELCHNQRTVLMTGYNLRFLSHLQHFRNLIKQEVMGEVLSVRCEVGQYLPSWRPQSDYRMSASASHKLGGGALLELSHEIDYLRWIFGEVDWAMGNLTRQSNLEIDVEDTAHLIFGFKSFPNRKPLVASLNLDFIRRDAVRQCTAICEQGSIRWDGLEGVVQIFDPSLGKWETVFSHLHDRDDSYLAEWRHLLECIDNKQPPMITGEDGLAVLNIILASRLASENHCAYYLDNIEEQSGN